MPETAEMGRVVVTAKIENLNDLTLVHLGQLGAHDVRSIVVDDALVDTGASTLAMPKSMIDQLGFIAYRDRPMRTANGVRLFKIYGMARLTINGRDCHVEVSELDDGCPVLIGQIPLELMDWVIDMKRHQLIGNPDHDGKWMMDMF